MFFAIQAAPVESISSAAMSGSAAASSMDVSIIGLIMQAGPVVKFVMLVLFLSSVWSWAVIIEKWVSIKSMLFEIQRFEKSFWSGQSLDSLYEKTKGHAKNPMAQVFVAAMQEWHRRSRVEQTSAIELRAGVKERINQAMHVAMNKALDKIDNNVSTLATIGSSAPFIGLFGTVWGIMVSFQSIAASKNTTLAVVAPGIAEALLATAFGLVAAIPAVIFYNKFANQISNISNSLEVFGMELGALMSRELDKR